MNKINHIRKALLNPPQVGRFPSPFGGVGGGFFFLLLCGSLFLLSGCNRDDLSGNGKEEPPVETGKMVPVRFTVSEAEYGDNEVVTRKAETNGEISRASIRIADDLNMYATILEGEAPVSLRAKVNLAPGTKVRIVAYSGAGHTTNVGHADYEVTSGINLAPYPPTGSPDPILAVPPGSIKFVAYSFDNASPMPPFSELEPPVNPNDVLWGETIVTVGGGSAQVHITMEHKKAKVVVNAVTINSSGPPDALNHISVNILAHNPTLTVRTGELNKTAAGAEFFSWSTLNPSLPSQTSDPMYVFTGDDNITHLRISNVTINGVLYHGPWFINYSKPVEAGKSYTLYVSFEREPFGGSVYRITWNALYNRYVVTNDPRDAGLYFKFGSVVGVFSDVDGNTGRVLTLPGTTSDPSFNPTRDIAWNPLSTAISSWANIPAYASSNFPMLITQGSNYHTIANVKAGKGDPCRLVGMDLNEIKIRNASELTYPQVDNGAWRLPSIAENVAFAGPSVTSSSHWWNLAGGANPSPFGPGVAGGEFPTRNSKAGTPDPTKFLPAAGYRHESGGVVWLQGISGDYWSNEPFSTTHGRSLSFDAGNVYTTTGNYVYNYGYTIRCVRQSSNPFNIQVSVEDWSPGGSFGTPGGEGDVNL